MRIITNLALFSGLLLLAGILPATAEVSAAAPQPPEYAQGGTQTCLKCHGTDARVTPILQSPMAVKGDPRTPFAQDGCETCHGPSAAHATNPGINKPNVVFKGPNISPVAVRVQQCLTCHENNLRMNWQGSQHQSNNIACNNCHTAHVVKDPVLVKLTQPEKCFTCHAQQRSDSFKYSHHPIREGLVVCADCHNPHGSPGPKLLKEFTVNETCYTCHADKRGPLVWEHEPVREDCLNCHTPHGSVQPSLLVERPPYLCQECHANSGHQAQVMAGQNLPGQIAANERLMNRGCENCHSQIHGSNSPNGAFFTR